MTTYTLMLEDTVLPSHIAHRRGVIYHDVVHAWLIERPRTWRDMCAVWSWWVIAHMADALPDDALAVAARQSPYIALSRVAHRLRPDVLRACALAEPATALRCAQRYLDDETTRACALLAPEAGLRFCSHVYSAAELAGAARAHPIAALTCARGELAEELVDELVEEITPTRDNEGAQ